MILLNCHLAADGVNFSLIVLVVVQKGWRRNGLPSVFHALQLETFLIVAAGRKNNGIHAAW